jgi:hypothetical protein
MVFHLSIPLGKYLLRLEYFWKIEFLFPSIFSLLVVGPRTGIISDGGHLGSVPISHPHEDYKLTLNSRVFVMFGYDGNFDIRGPLCNTLISYFHLHELD